MFGRFFRAAIEASRSTRNHDEQAQAAHRHPDLPHDSGERLLLRGQDRPYSATGRRRDALLPLAPAGRFGKSLFLDTCKELFEGNEALFEGLAIHGTLELVGASPVVRLSFGKGNFKRPGYLHTNLMAQLDGVERDTGVKSDYASGSRTVQPPSWSRLHRRAGQRVVVLVDEYDKPILDALDVPEVARANRDDCAGLYAVIKDSDAHIRFSFLTGVSKFSKVSLFSGLNNLIDITLDPSYSAICGYYRCRTSTRCSRPSFPASTADAIRDWYNGYGWLGEEKVYNPFDILLMFRNRKFGAWWFETGTPAFLVETLFRAASERGGAGRAWSRAPTRCCPRSTSDDIATEALLFQTGYLTIVGEEEGSAEEPSLSARLPQPRGTPEPEPRACWDYLVRARITPDRGQPHPSLPTAARQRLRRA